MHHIKQWETTIQIALFWCRPNFPCQQASSSTTVFNITHWMSNKINNMYHKLEVRGQWIRRWSTDSPNFFFYTYNTNLKSISFVSEDYQLSKYSPKQQSRPKEKKNRNSRRNLRLPNNLQREGLIYIFCQDLVVWANCKTSSLSGLPTNPNSPQRNSINTIQEIG